MRPGRFAARAALSRLIAVASIACAATACGSDASPTPPSASGTKTSAPPPAATSAKLDSMPIVSVDDMGPYIGGERASLKDQPGKDRLHALVGALPIKGQEVALTVLKKAKVSDVAAVVRELGLAGAPTVRISSSDARKDVPKELVVVPLEKLGDKAPGCAITAMVEKDLSTAVWSIKGGQGKKHDKGLAGPDLGNTGETLEKELKKCESTIAFFTAAPTLDWEHAHNIGGTILTSDKEKKIKTLVFLEKTPVPGREVDLTPP